MSEQPVAEYRIEDLAHRSGVTVRTIRAYQDRGLLPKPERRGRSNVYGTAHLTRLRQIAGLLDRGYTLASIRELLEAWDTGRGLGGVLGLATGAEGAESGGDTDTAGAAVPVRRPLPLGEHTTGTELGGSVQIFAPRRLHHRPAGGGAVAGAAEPGPVVLPVETIRAVQNLVGPENTAAFITAATERELQARTLDTLTASSLRKS
ncbi:MerR family transcriptional regulator [Streptomyces sp. NPDC094448]|uniref:MerR family transcriptional regulator n=1 Tax=Streptomyces sp. NPDC094448 TaxID=3366063 RepID=UPI0037F28281